MIISLLLWASIQLAATISPGPAFAMTVRTAMGNGRRSGIGLAMGLGLGIGTMMLLVAGGLALLIQQSILLFNILKYGGAAYLAYIGIKALRAKKQINQSDTTDTVPAVKYLTDFQAFRRGYLTNVLNPKGLVFFTAVSSQFIHHNTSLYLIGGYCLISMMIETSWFSLVATILNHRSIRERFMAIAHWVERVCGALLVALAVSLVFFKATPTT